MEQNKLISVLIPAYNHEKFIDKTIRSIINQSYDNVELIIIDDGSTDNTWKIMQSFHEECKKRFKRVIFETQTNHGTCYTLNKLISLAKGIYIYIIASDDMAKENALAIEYDFLEKNPEYILAVGDNEIINAESERIGWNEGYKSVPVEDAEYKTFAELLKIKEMGNLFGDYKLLSKNNHVVNGYLIRTDSLKRIPPFTSEAPLEDHYLQMQLSKLGKMKFIDQILFSYRWHGNNTILQLDKMKIYQQKTLNYEDILVHTMADKKWEKMFLANNTLRKKKVVDWKFFALYKLYTYAAKRIMINFCGMEFCLLKLPYEMKS